MSEQPPTTQDAADEGATSADAMGEAVSQAAKGCAIALLTFMLALLWLALQAARALLVLAVPALKLATVALMGYGALVLFQSIVTAYGGDLPAIVLALAVAVAVPAFLMIVNPIERTWGAMLSSGALSMLAHYGIERAPPTVLALIPCLILTAATLYFAFQRPDEHLQQTGEQGEQDERE